MFAKRKSKAVKSLMLAKTKVMFEKRMSILAKKRGMTMKTVGG